MPMEYDVVKQNLSTVFSFNFQGECISSPFAFMYVTKVFIEEDWPDLSSREFFREAIYDDSAPVIPVLPSKNLPIPLPMGLSQLQPVNYYLKEEESFTFNLKQLWNEKSKLKCNTLSSHLLKEQVQWLMTKVLYGQDSNSSDEDIDRPEISRYEFQRPMSVDSSCHRAPRDSGFSSNDVSNSYTSTRYHMSRQFEDNRDYIDRNKPSFQHSQSVPSWASHQQCYFNTPYQQGYENELDLQDGRSMNMSSFGESMHLHSLPGNRESLSGHIYRSRASENPHCPSQNSYMSRGLSDSKAHSMGVHNSSMQSNMTRQSEDFSHGGYHPQQLHAQFADIKFDSSAFASDESSSNSSGHSTIGPMQQPILLKEPLRPILRRDSPGSDVHTYNTSFKSQDSTSSTDISNSSGHSWRGPMQQPILLKEPLLPISGRDSPGSDVHNASFGSQDSASSTDISSDGSSCSKGHGQVQQIIINNPKNVIVGNNGHIVTKSEDTHTNNSISDGISKLSMDPKTSVSSLAQDGESSRNNTYEKQKVNQSETHPKNNMQHHYDSRVNSTPMVDIPDTPQTSMTDSNYRYQLNHKEMVPSLTVESLNQQEIDSNIKPVKMKPVAKVAPLTARFNNGYKGRGADRHAADYQNDLAHPENSNFHMMSSQTHVKLLPCADSPPHSEHDITSDEETEMKQAV